MALSLSSKGLRARAVSEARHAMPAAVAAGTALSTSAFLRAMKPGGMKTLVSLACVGGGGYMAIAGRSKISSSLSMGLLGGGLWSLVMK